LRSAALPPLVKSSLARAGARRIVKGTVAFSLLIPLKKGIFYG
jgi:hypothetical protein